jgi:hypothetical protein
MNKIIKSLFFLILILATAIGHTLSLELFVKTVNLNVNNPTFKPHLTNPISKKQFNIFVLLIPFLLSFFTRFIGKYITKKVLLKEKMTNIIPYLLEAFTGIF